MEEETRYEARRAKTRKREEEEEEEEEKEEEEPRLPCTLLALQSF